MADYNQQVIQEFRANNGKVGGMFGSMNLLLLTCTGAKSGQPVTKPLAYSRDGEAYIVAASKGGAPTNPAWYYNLIAHPDVTVEVAGEKFPARAELAGSAERRRLYDQHAAQYPTFKDYEAKTSREIPVFILHRL